MTTLIVGCSFPATFCYNKLPDGWQLRPDVVIRAMGGSGNQTIAARVAFECSQKNYDQVIVIWSGINRLDTMISNELHSIYWATNQKRNAAYYFFTHLNQSVWYHSGGQAGAWINDKSCPPEIKQIFKTKYLGANSIYLTNISLCSIFYTQSFLEKLNIKYQMSFIYDPFHDYSNTRHDHHLGMIDKQSEYYKLIDWSKINVNNTAFEWAKQDSSRFEKDQWHPTQPAMREWINLTFGIDIIA